ncbi:MAG TPA: EAL domain-containing protein [Leptolyngbyaceae cyanobacterium M65_K2018_010]|nr:EAL domain-containing protein [Leptolyngbyaceae cyanobacterium M65_K2018_010]
MHDLVNLPHSISLAVLNHLPDAIVVVNREGQPLLCNGQAKQLLHNYLTSLWQVDETSPFRILDRHHCPLTPDQLPLRRVLAGDVLENEEFILLQVGGGAVVWVAISGGPCQDTTEAAGIISVRNITRRKQQETQLHQQALHDQLTGLSNRNAFVNQVNAVLAQGRSPNSLALLFIDLDRFKEVNDNLGHGVGNELLAELGHRLRRLAPAHSLVARLGGDEFAVLLEHSDCPTQAPILASQLRDLIAQPFDLQQHDIYIDASIGIALGPAQYLHAEDWLRDADTAMYQIKNIPDSHWFVFDGALQVKQNQRLQVEMGLRQALQNGELRLHYQPIVTISTQAIHGFEALVRWQHPERGLLMPGQFIDTAEATGLIIPLGWWVLEEACRQMQAWTQAFPAMADLTISVNMSSKQFSQKNLVQRVGDTLARTGFDPHRLKIEITEGVLIDHSESIITILEQLRDMGIRLAVDDFGTGYSSLSYLHRFPFDSLKIDRSFIENADQDYEKLEILQSVVRLAWNLGLDVVAEGIETQRHYAQLKALRCELGQGYLFSRPLTPAAVEDILVNQPTLQLPNS